MHQKFQSPKHRVSRSGTPSFRSRYAPFQVLETFMLGYYILFRGRAPPPPLQGSSPCKVGLFIPAGFK